MGTKMVQVVAVTRRKFKHGEWSKTLMLHGRLAYELGCTYLKKRRGVEQAIVNLANAQPGTCFLRGNSSSHSTKLQDEEPNIRGLPELCIPGGTFTTTDSLLYLDAVASWQLTGIVHRYNRPQIAACFNTEGRAC